MTITSDHKLGFTWFVLFRDYTINLKAIVCLSIRNICNTNNKHRYK
ncbi:hypothetical protein [Polaribacter sp.]